VPETIVAGLTDGGLYGLLAVGIVLVYKGSRVLNFAQGEIGNLGLFAAWWVISERGLPWAVGALAAVLICGGIGLLFDRLVIQAMGDTSRISLTVATIGLLLLLLGVEFVVWGPSPQILRPPIEGLGPEVFGFFLSPTRILAVGTVAAIGLGLGAFLRYTDFGLGVLAASQDRDAARLVGVPLKRVSSFTWIVAGVLSAVAALLVAPVITLFRAGLMTALFVRGLAAALLGGLTSLPGAFVGGLAIGVIESVVPRLLSGVDFPGIGAVAVMLVVVAVLLFRPEGIFGAARA
jgi:branched-chain amino acid transport system permease protein